MWSPKGAWLQSIYYFASYSPNSRGQKEPRIPCCLMVKAALQNKCESVALFCVTEAVLGFCFCVFEHFFDGVRADQTDDTSVFLSAHLFKAALPVPDSDSSAWHRWAVAPCVYVFRHVFFQDEVGAAALSCICLTRDWSGCVYVAPPSSTLLSLCLSCGRMRRQKQATGTHKFLYSPCFNVFL